MAALHIVRPGLFTTVQDRGRWGYQAQGVPIAGAMDLYSHRQANGLIGNDEDAAALEVTLAGPSVEFTEAAVFAVTGGEFRLTMDDVAVPMNEAIEAKPGACLRFGERIRGSRAYLAVAGGVDVPLILGSRSTHALSRMGGHEGRALRAGDVLTIGEKRSGAFFAETARKRHATPFLPDGGATLRVIPGTFADLVTGMRFTISARSDRMGYRLEASHISAPVTAESISGAVPTGAIQLPPAGQPILLMPDHATTGGYEIAATVITADLPVAGQLAPGDWVEFAACSMEKADEALRAREAALAGGQS